LLGETKQQYEVLDFANNHYNSQSSHSILLTLCKPNLAQIHTTLKVEAYLVPGVGSVDQLSDDPEARNQAIARINSEFKKLQKGEK